MASLTIVVPTLNEARSLPRLLEALAAQTRPPDEVVVADAGSSDGTPTLAAEAGALVVPGGRPAAGRNAGASAASGELLFFLDADVRPPPDYLENVLQEYEREGLDVASTLIDALSDEMGDRIIADATNLYLLVVQRFSPHAPGFCILTRAELHSQIGGFDETVLLAEDHDYVQRSARYGRFGMLTGARLPVSMRRLETEGLVRLAFKYLWCEMHALAGKPIHRMPFKYEFGTHDLAPADRGRRILDVAGLREQIGRVANPIASFNREAGRTLERILYQESFSAFRTRITNVLSPTDLSTLQTYLSERLNLLRGSGRSLARSISRLSPVEMRESIRFIDLDWLKRNTEGEGGANERSRDR